MNQGGDAAAGSGPPRPRRLRAFLPLVAYQVVFLLAAIVWSPILAWRLAFDRRYRARFWARTGRIPRLPRAPRRTASRGGVAALVHAAPWHFLYFLP
ncbi:MAG: hypothetical protein HZB39_19285, partial [Planctomycetes bacterium]|nr:hypothetical protein [Planctomycetota bacterium]